MVDVKQLIWDEWNVAHIARHEVAPQEVEEVCQGDPLVQQSYQGRLAVIGPTAALRMLTVILDPVGDDVYYPVTARPASRKERRLYQKEIGGESR